MRCRVGDIVHIDSQIVYVPEQLASLPSNFSSSYATNPPNTSWPASNDKNVLSREQPFQVRVAGRLGPSVWVSKYTAEQCIQLAKQQAVSGCEAVERGMADNLGQLQRQISHFEAKSIGGEVARTVLADDRYRRNSVDPDTEPRPRYPVHTRPCRCLCDAAGNAPKEILAVGINVSSTVRGTTSIYSRHRSLTPGAPCDRCHL